MKIISLIQPWASLSVGGFKDVEHQSCEASFGEAWQRSCHPQGKTCADWQSQPSKRVQNRTWATKQRGIVGIHASANDKRREWCNAVATIFHIKKCSIDTAEILLIEMVGKFEDLPRGAILGTAEITDCTKKISSPWHFEDMYGFYLKNAKKFEPPIPASGALGFWEFDLESRGVV